MLTILKRFDEAKKRISWSINLRPSNPKCWFRRATANANDGLYDEAIFDIKKSLELDKGNKDIIKEYKRIVEMKNVYVRKNENMFGKG